MKRYRHEFQLLNPTKRKWSLFKSIDRKIVNLVKKHGITIIKTLYKDDLFIKIVIFDDINDGKNRDVILFKVGNLLGNHKTELNIISMLEVVPTVKIVKYIIKLIDSTPKKWAKYIALEPKIKKFAEDENILIKNLIYNHKDKTLSLVETYPNELARAIIGNKITLLMKRFGLEREIIEATESKDYSDDIIALPLYNANKLMDKAEQSLVKLSNMQI
jgi:hypothetical protein